MTGSNAGGDAAAIEELKGKAAVPGKRKLKENAAAEEKLEERLPRQKVVVGPKVTSG